MTGAGVDRPPSCGAMIRWPLLAAVVACCAARPAVAQPPLDRQAVYGPREAELQRAIADPTSLDALDFLVDVTRGTHTKDKHAYFKGILDRWAGGDTSPLLLKPRGMGPRR